MIQKRVLIAVLTGLIFLVSCNGEKSVKKEEGKTVILKEYFGLASFEEEGRNFLVIKDRKAYKAFIERIPKKLVTKGPRRTEDSKDPLLKKPEIDFDNYLMVAVVSDDWYAEITFHKIQRRGKDLIAEYSIRYPEEIYQKPLGIGTYRAMVLEKVPGEVIFQAPENL
jgi:hypothetical protein